VTAIAGFADGTRVWVGGDSASGRGTELRVRGEGKVFVLDGRMVLGFCGSARVADVVRYKLKPPDHDPRKPDREYLAAAFVDAMRAALKEAGTLTVKGGTEHMGGEFLLGYRGNLYAMYGDFQLGVLDDGIGAVGCGQDLCLGALAVGKGEPEDRVRAALAVAERFSAFVRGPFHVESVGHASVGHTEVRGDRSGHPGGGGADRAG
jgi:hypothetical protein